MAKIKVSSSKKWLKLKLKSGWKKIPAPATEKIMKPHMDVVKYLLELYGFKVEERNDKIIPREAELHGIKDTGYALPTISLHAHSSPVYPGLVCEYKYWGNNFGKHIVRGPETLPDSTADLFIEDMRELWRRGFSVYTQTKDISSVKKIFKEYYGVPAEEKPVEKPQLPEQTYDEAVKQTRTTPPFLVLYEHFFKPYTSERRPEPKITRNLKKKTLEERIVEALKKGPMPGGKIREKMKFKSYDLESSHKLNQALERLVKKGRIRKGLLNYELVETEEDKFSNS